MNPRKLGTLNPNKLEKMKLGTLNPKQVGKVEVGKF
jgi:hypothetical protein